MKSGYKTSELHITVITIAAGFLLSRTGLSEECKDEVITKVAPYLTAGLASLGYAVSRGIAKLKSNSSPTAAPAASPTSNEGK